MRTMAASNAAPWRMLPTILPKVYVSAKGMANSKNMSNQLVKAVGFSKGKA